MKNGSQTRGGRGIHRRRKKWNGRGDMRIYFYFILPGCLPRHPHADQEEIIKIIKTRSPWCRLVFRMRAQRVEMAWLSFSCKKLKFDCSVMWLVTNSLKFESMLWPISLSKKVKKKHDKTRPGVCNNVSVKCFLLEVLQFKNISCDNVLVKIDWPPTLQAHQINNCMWEEKPKREWWPGALEDLYLFSLWG